MRQWDNETMRQWDNETIRHRDIVTMWLGWPQWPRKQNNL